LVLSREEGRELVDAMLTVAKQYDLSISPASAAWTNLLIKLTLVYAVRLVQITRRREKELELDKQKRVETLRSTNGKPANGTPVAVAATHEEWSSERTSAPEQRDGLGI